MIGPSDFTGFLNANLAALHAWNPLLAERLRTLPEHPLDTTSDPSAWKLTTGRDGTITYARRIMAPSVGGGVPETIIQWLGGTSMPASSAAPLASNLEPGAHNGLGISIGTGYEWRALANRLASYQMIFVLEDDLANLRMVLEICDLSDVLQRGKVILLGGTELEAGTQLQHVLNVHPGIVPPDVMHPLPTLAPERRNDMLAIGERIIRAAITAQAQTAVAAQQALDQCWQVAKSSGDSKEEGGRRIMGLLFARPQRFGRISPELLAAAAQDGHHQVTTLQVDHHTSASLLFRAQQVASFRPDLLLGDLYRAQLEIGTSGGGGLALVPVYTLVPPDAKAGTWDPDRMVAASTLAPADRVICHDDASRRKLLAAGFTDQQIILLPLAITSPMAALPSAAPLSSPPPVSSSESVISTAAPLVLRHRVALLSENFSTDPNTYGLVLPTHQALWQAVCQIITEEFARLHPGLIGDVLRRAQQRSGVELRDPVLTDSLQRGLRDILLATLPARALAQTLAQAGLALQLLGSGWDAPDDKPPYPLPTGAQAVPYDAPDAWNQVAVAVHFTADGHIPPALLEAPFAGVPIVCLQTPAADWPGGLSTLLEPGKHYVTTALNQLIPTLRSLLRDAPRRAALAAAAAYHLRLNHTWEKRLAELLGPYGGRDARVT